MPGHRTAIFVRQAPRSDELHDAGIIEQQDRRAIAAERRFDAVHRRVVYLLEGIGAVKLLAE